MRNNNKKKFKKEFMSMFYLICKKTQGKQQITSAFTEMLAGGLSGSSVVLSLSDSDLELLSESLELADSTPLECDASSELQHTNAHTETQRTTI